MSHFKIVNAFLDDLGVIKSFFDNWIASESLEIEDSKVGPKGWVWPMDPRDSIWDGP